MRKACCAVARALIAVELVKARQVGMHLHVVGQGKGKLLMQAARLGQTLQAQVEQGQRLLGFEVFIFVFSMLREPFFQLERGAGRVTLGEQRIGQADDRGTVRRAGQRGSIGRSGGRAVSLREF